MFNSTVEKKSNQNKKQLFFTYFWIISILKKFHFHLASNIEIKSLSIFFWHRYVINEKFEPSFVVELKEKYFIF